MGEPHAMLVLDENRCIMAASPEAATLLGLSVPRLLGMPCRQALVCGLGNESLCPARQALAGLVADHAPLATSGRESGRRVLVTAQPLVESGRSGRRAVLYLRQPHLETDVAAQASRRLLPLTGVEDGLQSVLDDLRRLLGSDLAALALYDRDARQVQWQLASGNVSKRINEIRLRPGQGFAGRIIASLRPLETAAFPTDLTRNPTSYPIFLREELRSAVGVPLEAAGRPVGVLMVANRRTHRFTPEDRMVLSSVAEVVSLAAENVRLYREAGRRAQVTERRRLAEEVHDATSQHLFGLQLLLEDVQEALAGGDPGAVQDGLRRVSRVLDSSLLEVRRLIARLRGEVSEAPGFIAALCDYLEYFYRMSGLEVELSLPGDGSTEIITPHQHEILRIAQEALTNVHRHAGARHVQLEVSVQEQGFTLRIQDDGKGFDLRAPRPSGHYGLEIMQERARRTGSNLTIESAPGRGTVVTIYVPETGCS